MELTRQQQKAAYAGGSVVVTAGAGTGKTAMLATRFLHLVTADNLRPIEIVAVTFTDKAAAELRQRIRARLSEKLTDEALIAEVDAAQISTIHALSARICRDFYYLAGIPADFRILDETDSKIRLAHVFEEAMGGIDQEIISELGYSWLKKALEQLLSDPYSSNNAFEKGEAEWRQAVEETNQTALSDLLTSDAWRGAAGTLSRYRAAGDDKLEAYRCAAIGALEVIESGGFTSATFDVFKGFRSNLGAKGKWPDGGLDEVRICLADLRDVFREHSQWITLEFTEADSTAAARVKMLRDAFFVVYRFLSEFKNREKILDYADLEIHALKILGDGAARQHYVKRWRAFLVDEFQDTNQVQAEIIRLLRSDASVTIVGDEKQSIYGFRRADVTVFRELRESVTQAGGEAVELSETFRAHATLVGHINRIFEPVLGDLHQELEANRKESPFEEIPVSVAIVAAEKGVPTDKRRIVESRFIADEIVRMIASGMTVFDKNDKKTRAIEYRDIAILSRTWSAIDVYIDALSAKGIPAVNAGGGSLLDTREAKDAVAMLNFLVDTGDDISLVAVLRSPFFAISDRLLAQAAAKKEKGQTWWELIQNLNDEFANPCKILSDLQIAAKLNSPERLLELADAETGYTAVIANLAQGGRREADWLGFLAFTRKLARAGRGDLFGAVRHIAKLIGAESDIPRPPLDAGDAVALMTVHKAKGLEWPVVFVPDLAGKTPPYTDKLIIDNELGIAFAVDDEAGEKIEPSIYRLIKRRKAERDTGEAKRVLYVAVTRARDRVILTAGGEKGNAIDLMRPGIEAANIEIADIEYSDELAIPPAPGDPPQFELPDLTQTGVIAAGLTAVPVTALTDYARCPLQFRYRYVDGHPGLGEGDSHARTIGTLTHTALEWQKFTVEELRPICRNADDESLEEAIRLADNFRKKKEFEQFRNVSMEREQGFVVERGGITLHGIADLVGDDFVLDYKTDAEVNPDEHRFQLWTYAEALKKPKAFIAYLREPYLHEFLSGEIERAGMEASGLLGNIAAGQYGAAPTLETCGRCIYSSICDSSMAKNRDEENL